MRPLLAPGVEPDDILLAVGQETTMADVVVTVPKDIWQQWVAEGDLPGEVWSGNWYHFYIGGSWPNRIAIDDPWKHGRHRLWFPVKGDSRCYIVTHGRLRGYAPLVYLESEGVQQRLNAFIRGGEAVSVTLREPLLRRPGCGMPGWSYRWWDRSQERPFPEWRTP